MGKILLLFVLFVVLTTGAVVCHRIAEGLELKAALIGAIELFPRSVPAGEDAEKRKLREEAETFHANCLVLSVGAVFSFMFLVIRLIDWQASSAEADGSKRLEP